MPCGYYKAGTIKPSGVETYLGCAHALRASVGHIVLPKPKAPPPILPQMGGYFCRFWVRCRRRRGFKQTVTLKVTVCFESSSSDSNLESNTQYFCIYTRLLSSELTPNFCCLSIKQVYVFAFKLVADCLNMLLVFFCIDANVNA